MSLARVLDLPFEIRQYVTNYLQEELYVTAFTQLRNILAAGSDDGSGAPRRIFVPTPQVLALASSLVVYPPLTSRLPADERTDGPDLALSYFREVTCVGQIRQLLGDSLVFASQDPARASRRRRRSLGSGVDDNAQEHQDSYISTHLAVDESLYALADDFWSVVGWAFNCSIHHPLRWDRWRVWLEAMLDLLERDLEDKISGHDYSQGSESQSDSSIFDTALITRYVSHRTAQRSEKRKVLRAILADGSTKSVQEFGPIWKNETKPPKEPTIPGRSDKKLDIDNDEYADYLDEDDDDIDLDTLGNGTSTRRASRRKPQPEPILDSDLSDADDIPGTTTTSTFAPPSFGDDAAMHLRQRLLALLSNLTYYHPSPFGDLEDFLDVLSESLRPLPLPIFMAFTLPSTPYQSDSMHSSLLRMLLRPLLSSAAPAFDDAALTQPALETCYLPFAAVQASAVANAKVSILVEGLMRLVWKHEGLVLGTGLAEAVEKGRRARFDKVSFDGRRRTVQSAVVEEEASRILEQSAQRMAALLAIVER